MLSGRIQVPNARQKWPEGQVKQMRADDLLACLLRDGIGVLGVAEISAWASDLARGWKTGRAIDVGQRGAPHRFIEESAVVLVRLGLIERWDDNDRSVDHDAYAELYGPDWAPARPRGRPRMLHAAQFRDVYGAEDAMRAIDEALNGRIDVAVCWPRWVQARVRLMPGQVPTLSQLRRMDALVR